MPVLWLFIFSKTNRKSLDSSKAWFFLVILLSASKCLSFGALFFACVKSTQKKGDFREKFLKVVKNTRWLIIFFLKGKKNRKKDKKIKKI